MALGHIDTQIEASELQSMTPEETLRRSDLVLSLPIPPDVANRQTSGLVEQQAVFMRWWDKHKS